MALRRIEFESSRLIQAQILFLKSADLQAVPRRRKHGRRTAAPAGPQIVGRAARRHRHQRADTDG